MRLSAVVVMASALGIGTATPTDFRSKYLAFAKAIQAKIAEYENPSPPESEISRRDGGSSSYKTGIIVVGVILVLAILFAIFYFTGRYLPYFVRKRAQHKRQRDEDSIYPEDDGIPNPTAYTPRQSATSVCSMTLSTFSQETPEVAVATPPPAYKFELPMPKAQQPLDMTPERKRPTQEFNTPPPIYPSPQPATLEPSQTFGLEISCPTSPHGQSHPHPDLQRSQGLPEVSGYNTYPPLRITKSGSNHSRPPSSAQHIHEVSNIGGVTESESGRLSRSGTETASTCRPSQAHVRSTSEYTTRYSNYENDDRWDESHTNSSLSLNEEVGYYPPLVVSSAPIKRKKLSKLFPLIPEIPKMASLLESEEVIKARRESKTFKKLEEATPH